MRLRFQCVSYGFLLLVATSLLSPLALAEDGLDAVLPVSAAPLKATGTEHPSEADKNHKAASASDVQLVSYAKSPLPSTSSLNAKVPPPGRAPPANPVLMAQQSSPSGSAFDQPPASSVVAPAYEDILRRLDQTEAELRLMHQEHRTSAVNGAPSKKIHAEAPHNDPVEHRVAELEKKAGKEEPAHFPTIKVSGFFQADWGFFNQDANSLATLGDIQDGAGFRRTRLQALGSVAEFVNYSIEMDFAGAGRPTFMDVWGEATHLPGFGTVRVGHFRQPFGLEALNSVRQLTFLERALPFNAFVPFRRPGIMAYNHAEDQLTTWAYSGFRTGGFNQAPLGDDRFATDIGDNGGYSFSGRMTHLLWYDEPAEGRYLVHLGAAYNYGNLDGKFYQARAIPEFFVGDPAGGGAVTAGTPFFVDTGRIAADDFHLFGTELAAQAGPWRMQAEYMHTIVNQIGGPLESYLGAYLETSWFLTGENRPYNRATGVFERLKPFEEFFALGHEHCYGRGAWELTGRWSYVDVNNTTLSANSLAMGPHPGGRLHDFTTGVNWYLNAYTKLQFNYIRAFLDNPTTGNSNTDIFAMRAQVDF